MYRKTKEIKPQEVVDLILDGNIVCLFQGKVEAGPRALGNRSLLFDPRNPSAQQIVNLAKKREIWRPFAATVLEEHASEWFEMNSLPSSPFMMFAIPVKEEKKKLIPGVTHVDGTCRIQTLDKQDNPAYRELIELFHQKTGVPMLFNTSLNLGGEVICYTLEHVIDVIEESSIEYLYCPQQSELYFKGN